MCIFTFYENSQFFAHSISNPAKNICFIFDSTRNKMLPFMTPAELVQFLSGKPIAALTQPA